jgi:hypothetical protein
MSIGIVLTASRCRRGSFILSVARFYSLGEFVPALDECDINGEHDASGAGDHAKEEL